jgi:hypothetical protein
MFGTEAGPSTSHRLAQDDACDVGVLDFPPLLRKDGEPGHEAALAVFILGKERAEAIEFSLPCGAVVADPLLHKAKTGGLDAAGSYAA